jgi:hypothetical protein
MPILRQVRERGCIPRAWLHPRFRLRTRIQAHREVQHRTGLNSNRSNMHTRKYTLNINRSPPHPTISPNLILIHTNTLPLRSKVVLHPLNFPTSCL